jgi:hypothetical protein
MRQRHDDSRSDAPTDGIRRLLSGGAFLKTGRRVVSIDVAAGRRSLGGIRNYAVSMP